MVRFSSSKPMRPRSDRARRRVLFSAESLETRQLLSVAAMQPVVAPVPAIPVPAAFGPVSTVAGGLGSSISPVVVSPVYEVTLQVNPIVQGGFASHGFTETILVIDEPIATGSGATSPTTPVGPISSTGSGTSSPTPTGGASETTGNNAITPLTATVLAGPAGGGRAGAIVVVAPQPVVSFFGSSTIPVTTQAILNTATLEEQPLAPPVLGQGFESGQTQGLDPRIDGLFKAPQADVPLEPTIPAIDVIEPFQPAVVPAPAAQPAQPDDVLPAPAPVRDVEPAQVVPVEPAILTDWDRAPEFPILSPRTKSQSEAEAPSWSMAAMVGTAAIAGGGYHLVLGRSNRFNQRWLPTRGTSKPSRGRKSEEK